MSDFPESRVGVCLSLELSVPSLCLDFRYCLGTPSVISGLPEMSSNARDEEHRRLVSALNEPSERHDSIGTFDIVGSASSDGIDDDEDLFADRKITEDSISPDQALIHMMKCMMGTGMLSLPLAFKQSGLALGMIMLVIIGAACTKCARQLVIASHYTCWRKGQDKMDYANVMRTAVEIGPRGLRGHAYLAKQIVNVNIFVAQLGFCCVYFVFMAENLKQFFDSTSTIRLSKATWIALLVIPEAGLCTIRHLKALAPLAFLANIVYTAAVAIVLGFLFTDPLPSYTLPAFPTDWSNLPLFFGTVMFSYLGIAVVLPIENQMNQPYHFISPTGVLNTSCILVLLLYCFVGFFGFLQFGDEVADTITLNLPKTPFYEVIMLMFSACILVSYPLQFYVPMERIEKWISRKIRADRQEFLIYFIRGCSVMMTCLMAELIPHLALFISLVGAFASTVLSLMFPPIMELLCCYARGTLNKKVWATNILLLMFALLGFTTGTYTSLLQIVEAFGKD